MRTIFRPALLVALAMGVLLSACGAALMPPAPPPEGEMITMLSTPTGANVVVKNGSGEILGSGVTPFQLRVRCSHTIIATFSADGYDSQTVEDDGTQPLGGLNVGPFLLNPFNTGANACHKLAQVNVTLKKRELELE